MSAPDFSVERALAALQTPGFYSEDDHKVGEHALRPFEGIDTEAGLEFYDDNVLGNKVSVVLEISLRWLISSSAYQVFSSPPLNAADWRVIGHSPQIQYIYISSG
jgi:hypothetical protein